MVKDVKVGFNHGCSDHEIMEFRIPREVEKAKSRITTLGFRSTQFALFRDLLGRFLWEMVLEGRRVEES